MLGGRGSEASSDTFSALGPFGFIAIPLLLKSMADGLSAFDTRGAFAPGSAQSLSNAAQIRSSRRERRIPLRGRRELHRRRSSRRESGAGRATAWRLEAAGLPRRRSARMARASGCSRTVPKLSARTCAEPRPRSRRRSARELRLRAGRSCLLRVFRYPCLREADSYLKT